ASTRIQAGPSVGGAAVLFTPVPSMRPGEPISVDHGHRALDGRHTAGLQLCHCRTLYRHTGIRLDLRRRITVDLDTAAFDGNASRLEGDAVAHRLEHDTVLFDGDRASAHL